MIRSAVIFEKGRSLLVSARDYTVVDLETTGLDPHNNEIIEIGAVRVRDGVVTDQYDRLVRPEYPVSSFITGLTGISNAMLKNAPSIRETLPSFLEFAGNDLIVGHNVNFDLNFLTDKCSTFLERGFTNDFVDTMRLSRKLYPQERHHRLCDLAERFGLTNENAHRALSDVLVTQQSYEIMLRYMEQNGIIL